MLFDFVNEVEGRSCWLWNVKNVKLQLPRGTEEVCLDIFQGLLAKKTRKEEDNVLQHDLWKMDKSLWLFVFMCLFFYACGVVEAKKKKEDAHREASPQVPNKDHVNTYLQAPPHKEDTCTTCKFGEQSFFPPLYLSESNQFLPLTYSPSCC